GPSDGRPDLVPGGDEARGEHGHMAPERPEITARNGAMSTNELADAKKDGVEIHRRPATPHRAAIAFRKRKPVSKRDAEWTPLDSGGPNPSTHVQSDDRDVHGSPAAVHEVHLTRCDVNCDVAVTL